MVHIAYTLHIHLISSVIYIWTCMSLRITGLFKNPAQDEM